MIRGFIDVSVFQWFLYLRLGWYFWASPKRCLPEVESATRCHLWNPPKSCERAGQPRPWKAIGACMESVLDEVAKDQPSLKRLLRPGGALVSTCQTSMGIMGKDFICPKLFQTVSPLCFTCCLSGYFNNLRFSNGELVLREQFWGKCWLMWMSMPPSSQCWWLICCPPGVYPKNNVFCCKCFQWYLMAAYQWNG